PHRARAVTLAAARDAGDEEVGRLLARLDPLVAARALGLHQVRSVLEARAHEPRPRDAGRGERRRLEHVAFAAGRAQQLERGTPPRAPGVVERRRRTRL